MGARRVDCRKSAEVATLRNLGVHERTTTTTTPDQSSAARRHLRSAELAEVEHGLGGPVDALAGAAGPDAHLAPGRRPHQRNLRESLQGPHLRDVHGAQPAHEPHGLFAVLVRAAVGVRGLLVGVLHDRCVGHLDVLRQDAAVLPRVALRRGEHRGARDQLLHHVGEAAVPHQVPAGHAGRQRHRVVIRDLVDGRLRDQRERRRREGDRAQQRLHRGRGASGRRARHMAA
mmetsp:Transcript_522/g.1421  ORF Transcript_522/g.1421 Transcript_522/m.1421 type:complete len:230 (+) Transcript_522:119-808(+)